MHSPRARHMGADESVVSKIEVVGLARTRPEVVQRDLLFQPGDRLSQVVSDEMARNLWAFLFLDEIEIRLGPGSGELCRCYGQGQRPVFVSGYAAAVR